MDALSKGVLRNREVWNLNRSGQIFAFLSKTHSGPLSFVQHLAFGRTKHPHRHHRDPKRSCRNREIRSEALESWSDSIQRERWSVAGSLQVRWPHTIKFDRILVYAVAMSNRKMPNFDTRRRLHLHSDPTDTFRLLHSAWAFMGVSIREIIVQSCCWNLNFLIKCQSFRWGRAWEFLAWNHVGCQQNLQKGFGKDTYFKGMHEGYVQVGQGQCFWWHHIE